MRTPFRIATTAVALAAVFPIGVGPAQAVQGLSEPASAAAYFSSTTPAKDDAMPADPAPNFIKLGTDRVAENNLAVAVTIPNQSDKESFVKFDLQSLLELTYAGKTVTISKATVTAPLVENSQDNNTANADPAKVKACLTGPEGFADGTDAAAYDEKPTVDCDKFTAPAKATKDGKAYTFDVTPVANSWLTDLNDGIALVPADLSQPFQVVFAKRELITIAVSYDVTGGEVVTPTLPSTPPLPPTDLGGGTGTTYVPPVTNTGTAPQPQVGSAPQPQVTKPKPTVAPRPAVAAPVRPITTVAGNGGFAESNSPSAAFWLAALAGVGLLGAMSLFLGTTEVPPAAGSVQNGVGRALDERRRAGQPGVRTARTGSFRTA